MGTLSGNFDKLMQRNNNRALRWEWGLLGCLLWVGLGEAQLTETTAAAGLSGDTSLAPGVESKLFTIGLTGNGTDTLDSLALTLSDLSSATSIDTSDIDTLKLYVSSDATLDPASDVLLASVPGGSVVFGSALTLAPTSGHTPPNATERFYLVSVRLDSTVGDGRAFKVGFAAGGASTSAGTVGTAVAASDSDKITIAVTATKLVFAQAPADAGVVDSKDEVVNGQIFSTQPIVEAQDALGNVDVDFGENMTIALGSGAGVLAGTLSRTTISGKADFVGNSLSYSATADGEAFTLVADDASGGVDLTAASTSGLSADAVASKLVFAKEPTLLLEPGANFAADSVNVAAQDANGLVDFDYGGHVRIQAVSAENSSVVVGDLATVPGDSVAAVNGVAIWTGLSIPQADLIKLKTTSGSLTSALSATVALPGAFEMGSADSLVAANLLAGLAGVGGSRVVFNVLALRAVGERIPLQALKIKPIYSGFQDEELRNFDLILDENADGLVGSTERSVLAAAVDDENSGIEVTMTVIDTLPADTLQYYLLAADLSHTMRSTDSISIDVTDVTVGSGVATGVAPSVPVRSISGPTHVVSGETSIVSVELENERVGQLGKATIVFDTVSDLGIGDELVLDFPQAFNLSAVATDAATITPSGIDPSVGANSAGTTVVLDLGAAETKGRYQIVLDGVRNPSSDQGAAPISVYTRLAEGTVVDAADSTPPGIELQGSGRIALSSVERINGSAGQVGEVALTFTTATPLGVGDEIELVFPQGFDVSGAVVEAATKTPSSSELLLDSEKTAEKTIVLDLQAQEVAGEISLMLSGVVFPDSAARGLTVEIRTRQDDGLVLDLPDESPATLAIPGRLRLVGGSDIGNSLEGVAGLGGERLVLTAFRLEASGEAVLVREVELVPHLVGVSPSELTSIDLIHDTDADGLIDAAEVSAATAAVDDGGDGVSFRVVLEQQEIDSGGSRSYLVVGSIAAGISSNDQIQIDVVDVSVVVGEKSGALAEITGGPVVGPIHRTTGHVEIKSINLANGQTGGSGTIRTVLSTASSLDAGDRLVLEFAAGFDVSLAVVDESSRTPSGSIPKKLEGASTRQRLVIEVAEGEAAGEFTINLQGVLNPGVALRDISISVQTERPDGEVIDEPDSSPPLFSIVKTALPLVCRADFDADGRVYFSDLFSFGDAFGTTGSSIYDLDADGIVGFEDFFVLSEVFGQSCSVDENDPVDDTVQPLELVVELGVTPMSFSLVRAGHFTMGSPSTEEGRGSDEGLQRVVEITQSFYLGQFEVSQGQWQAVMGTSPWQGLPAVIDSAGHPAVYIGWNDASAFVQTLNAAAGDSLYRLPSEAEWEYAARAGTSTRWSFGDDSAGLADYAWTRRVPAVVSELVTHPVGSKLPNPWTLYDMHGSAAEWVGDYYGAYGTEGESDPLGPASGSARVLRGGGITLGAEATRSAARASFDPGARLSTFGFRIVRRIK